MAKGDEFAQRTAPVPPSEAPAPPQSPPAPEPQDLHPVANADAAPVLAGDVASVTMSSQVTGEPEAELPHSAAMAIPILYLLAIGAAEVTTLISPVAGVVFHVFLLLTLSIHASIAGPHPTRKLYLGLALAPLIRILSLSMPLNTIPTIYWFAIIAVPLLSATFLTIRLLAYSRHDLGLTLGSLPSQSLIALMGFPLGLLEYVILRPKPLIESFSFGAVWPATLILVVGTGFTEELIFRGVLQKAALERMRRGGLIYVSLLFSLLHVGYGSVAELVFVFSVGLFLSWAVARSGSLLGATLAHGLLNVTLFVLLPFSGIPLAGFAVTGIPDISFLP